MSFAIVFCGQGSQHPLMLPWLAADDALVDRACALLGIVDWRERLQARDWATANANAQVLLTGLSLAAWQQIANHVPAPACVAGYSVGELASFSAAGVFDAACALALAGERAEVMDRCARKSPGGLLAISGVPPATIDALCTESGAALAISNGPESAVLGGPDAALARVEQWASRQGIHIRRLAVGLASHTPWMGDAAADFAVVLASHQLAAPRLPLFSNAADRIHDAAQASSALAAQIATTVRWDECMENIHARAPDCVLEIGPGRALAQLWNQRYPAVPARSCDDFRSIATLIEWIAKHGSQGQGASGSRSAW